MDSLNKVELRGNVGNIRISDVGEKHVARFSVATNFISRNKTGEQVIETTWHNVVAWEGKEMPELQSIGKGMGIYVCGRLKTNKYTANDGSERTTYEIIANKVEVLS